MKAKHNKKQLMSKSIIEDVLLCCYYNILNLSNCQAFFIKNL